MIGASNQQYTRIQLCKKKKKKKNYKSSFVEIIVPQSLSWIKNYSD